tara:strand:+ start:521 stop:727 length:207 start_codon:yes stop_codon:yes gene_type:complete
MFKTKTVDSIMAVFTKTITDLEAVRNAELDRQYNLADEHFRLEQELEKSRAEAERAVKLIDNLKGLVQ